MVFMVLLRPPGNWVTEECDFFKCPLNYKTTGREESEAASGPRMFELNRLQMKLTHIAADTAYALYCLATFLAPS
jgi:hypothetical protein